MYKCECGREFENKQAYCSHHGFCKVANPEGAKKRSESLRGRKMPTPWNKGLTKYTDERVKDMSVRLSASMKDSESARSHLEEMTRNRTKASYEKMSRTRRDKFLSGELIPPVGAGRGKYSYLSYEGKRVLLRSTYEFIYALYLLYNDIEFEYESICVPAVTDYKYSRSFRSDFLIGNTVIEIKGYKSSKVLHAKAAFESAGYRYEVKYWEDLFPCYEYLKSKVDIDSILESIRKGHDSKNYYEYKFIW